METKALLNERGNTHGDWDRQSQATSAIKDVFYTHRTSLLTISQKEALAMIATKLGRILAGDPDFRDHWDDIAGYAKLAAERCSK